MFDYGFKFGLVVSLDLGLLHYGCGCLPLGLFSVTIFYVLVLLCLFAL